MRLLNVGLSRTGTRSVHEAAQALGFSSIHYDKERLDWAVAGYPGDFRVYDDIDVVSDLPSALFYLELQKAYPDARIMLTVRDEGTWWDSVERYFKGRPSLAGLNPASRLVRSLTLSGRKGLEGLRFRDDIRVLAYTCAVPDEWAWRGAYRRHNDRVRACVGDRLIEVDLSKGGGWPELCEALDVPVPNIPFPHRNKTTIPARPRSLAAMDTRLATFLLSTQPDPADGSWTLGPELRPTFQTMANFGVPGAKDLCDDIRDTGVVLLSQA